jgi:hypothetical protein
VKPFLDKIRDSALANIGVAVSTWLIVSWSFAKHQEIWGDEATQLSGLSLGPLEVVAWLAGKHPERFGGIPPDRMPPLGYWIGWVWSKPFGVSELSLRAMGIVAVAVAIFLIVQSARRIWGGWAGWVAGLTFALSPNVIVAGVEIRAYPFLLLWSACVFWFLLRLTDDLGRKRAVNWVGLGISCVAACYTHFFGFVLTGAALVGASWIALRDRQIWSRLAIVGGAIVAGVAAGIWPFVAAAISVSNSSTVIRKDGPPPSVDVKHALLRLAYRSLGGHPTMSVHHALLVATVGGAVLGFAVASWQRESALRGTRVLILSLAAGFSAVALATFAARAFDASSPTYNVWMLPAIVLVCSSVLAGTGQGPRIIGWIASLLVLIGNTGATAVLLRHADVFAHSAADRINAEVAASDVTDMIVIHDAAGQWTHTYSPLRYAFGSNLPQYLAEQRPGGLDFYLLPNHERVLDSPLRSKNLLVVDCVFMKAEEIADFLHTNREPPLSDGTLWRALKAEGWVPAREETFVAFDATHLDWMSHPTR